MIQTEGTWTCSEGRLLPSFRLEVPLLWSHTVPDETTGSPHRQNWTRLWQRRKQAVPCVQNCGWRYVFWILPVDQLNENKISCRKSIFCHQVYNHGLCRFLFLRGLAWVLRKTCLSIEGVVFHRNTYSCLILRLHDSLKFTQASDCSVELMTVIFPDYSSHVVVYNMYNLITHILRLVTFSIL